ncbi:conjugal transfer protein [Paenibacillus polymyxa]|uniref:conjugal transfer protein n=1 Tax=Paenibacillus polymyxa TaxID=1406 RepID=UPI0025B6D7D8|nr:conjugal transfer protein [Paenibacillus polymyxa]MDN4081220.1 conjugal transfer protein [Paenibacillus polymyxa]MDN4106923.1 conjugal transfer protein [Paenibacillus polymyxa]MDN4116860.1 conjugal transfer protein [Paenibacillus polymyxa]
MAKSLEKRKQRSEGEKREKVSLWTHIKNLSKREAKPVRKAYRPKGYVARKMGFYLFWIMFVFMFLVVFVTVMAPKGSSQADANQTEKKATLNPATTTTGVQYAQNFAKEYFTWAPGDAALKERQKRLEPFLAKGLDKQAGLETHGLQTKSTFLKTEIKNIEEKGDNRAYVTLKVYQKVEVPQQVPNQKAGTGKTVPLVKYKPMEVQKFFVVPVGYDQSYGIYDLPKFSFMDSQTTLEKDDAAKGLTDAENSQEKANVRNFLDTFFSSYVSDPRDKLAYLLEDPKHPNGLNKTMDFVSVNTAQVYQGAAPKQYIVLANITLEDPKTKDRYNMNYRLYVIEKNSRYVVTTLDEK